MFRGSDIDGETARSGAKRDDRGRQQGAYFHDRANHRLGNEVLQRNRAELIFGLQWWLALPQRVEHDRFAAKAHANRISNRSARIRGASGAWKFSGGKQMSKVGGSRRALDRNRQSSSAFVLG